VTTEAPPKPPLLSRRNMLALSAAMVGAGAFAYAVRRKIRTRIAALTQHPSFTAVPALVPHDPVRDRSKVYVAKGGSPAANVDDVMSKLGGIEKFVGTDDVVIIKVSAQWWNQGMTNVAAVKRVIEHVLERPGFKGEIIVFENTHFRLANGSGLSRAWLHPSERNVDVPGWTKLGDLIPYFQERKAPVSFVGLVDAGPSALSDDHWHDPSHEFGRYGGDGRGPIASGEIRDGYHWDFDRAFRLARSWVDEARTPLSWPRFTSPLSELVIDLKDGVQRRQDGRLVSVVGRKLTWINMTTANEHGATGLTAACKSTMGIVDMSAGELGTHPLARGYASVHYFGRGSPSATWRMGGPLAHFAREVRSPDLILTVAEWVAFAPADWDSEKADIRHRAETCVQRKTIVAGTDPVAIDTWTARNVMADVPSAFRKERLDLDNPDSTLTKFLRYYRQVYERGTLDPALIDVV
jgi:hypothetical protein